MASPKTYAILGATGNVGSSVLKVLTQDPNNSSSKVHAFVRSKKKLLGQQPFLESNSSVKIFEGTNSDIPTLARCIRGTDAVFLCIAGSQNTPGMSMSEDTARTVVAALQRLQDEDPRAKMPLLVVLSSASLEDSLSGDIPWFAKSILLTAESYVYADLRNAETFLRSKEIEQDMGVRSVFMKPGGLSNDVQSGHILSTTESQTFLSFMDLAGGMVEVAETNETTNWQGKNVSVLAKKKAKVELWIPWILVTGLFGHFFPELFLWLTK